MRKANEPIFIFPFRGSLFELDHVRHKPLVVARARRYRSSPALFAEKKKSGILALIKTYYICIHIY